MLLLTTRTREIQQYVQTYPSAQPYLRYPFWSLVLNTNKKQGNVPKLFLGRFMTVTFFAVFIAFFLLSTST